MIQYEVTLDQVKQIKEDILAYLKETPTNDLLIQLGKYVDEDLSQNNFREF